MDRYLRDMGWKGVHFAMAGLHDALMRHSDFLIIVPKKMATASNPFICVCVPYVRGLLAAWVVMVYHYPFERGTAVNAMLTVMPRFPMASSKIVQSAT